MQKFFESSAIDQLNVLNMEAKELNVSLEELVMLKAEQHKVQIQK